MTLVKDSKALAESRWGDAFLDGWHNAEVLYEEVEGDYQGSAEVLAVLRGDGTEDTYLYTSWSWGSDDYCDPFEGLSQEQQNEAFASGRLVLDKKLLRAWRDMLVEGNSRWRINLIAAINKELGE